MTKIIFFSITFICFFAASNCFANFAEITDSAAYDTGSPGLTVEELTIKKSIELAVELSTVSQKYRNDIELNGAQVLQAYGQFLPNLSTALNVNRMDGKTYVTATSPANVESTSYGASLSISSSINIFNGHADVSSLRAALDRKSAAILTFARAKQQVALDVAQAFYQVAFDQKLVLIARENLKVSKEREVLIREQVRLGSRNLADLYRQEAQTSADESFLVNSISKQHLDLMALLKRLRLDARKRYRVVEPTPQAYAELEAKQTEKELIQIGLANRADYQAGERLLNASRSELQGARAGLFPRIDFGISVVGSGRIFQNHVVNSRDSVPLSQTSLEEQIRNQVGYTIGLSLVWNLFDRSVSRASEQKAGILLRNFTTDYQDLRNSIVADIRQASFELQSAIQRLKSANKGLVSAQKAFQIIQAKARIGAVSFVELSSAQVVLVQSESAYAQALYMLELQKRAFATALGTTKSED